VQPVRSIRAVVTPPDWVLPLLLCGLGAAEIWDRGFGDQIVGGRAANTLVMALAVVPLFRRRRYPVVVLGLVIGACVIFQLPLYGLTSQPPFTPFLAALIAIYGAASSTEGRDMWISLAMLSVGALLFAASIAGQGPNQVPGLLFLLIAWGLGRTIGRGRRTESTLRQRAETLEQESEQRAAAAAAEERARIARELHDVIAHSVSVMVLQASVERRMLGDREPQTREGLAGIERVGREALTELRRLLGVMRKEQTAPALSPQPAIHDLPRLAEQFRPAGLAVTISTSGERVPLAPGLELSAYRIVQEALTNAVKHGNAHRANVELNYGAAQLDLDISSDTESDAGPEINGRDRGPGVLPSGGHGMIGMRERARLHDGELDAGPIIDGRFKVHATLRYDST